MELIERSCPVCGPGAPGVVFAEANIDTGKLDTFAYASRKLPELMHFRLVRCGTCDLLYASPAPPPESLQEAYEEASYDSGEEARYAARTYMRYAREILPGLPDRAGALDIGAGDGAFLEQLLDAGFTGVEGVEPSEAPIRAADERVRPFLKKGLFHAEGHRPGTYSLVSCFMTMEHLYDPSAMCRAAQGLLKPGGAFITVAHNYRSFFARVLGSRSPIFDIEHLQLFSPDSLRKMMENCGFSRVRIMPIANRYPLHYWMKISPLGSGVKKRALAFSRSTGIGNIPLSVRGGNLFAVGFKGGAEGAGRGR